MTEGSVRRTARRLTAAGGEALDEIVAEEVAVALVYNGISHAVMMATPCDLEDLARGFSLTERIVDKPSEIYDVEVEPVEGGIEVRLDIAAQRMVRLQERRRSLAGRTGCGLCGIDSIEAAMRPVTVVGATPPVSRGRHRAGDGGPAARAAHQSRERRHPRRRLGAAGRRTGRRARGCRPAQCARQAGRRLGESGALQPGGFVVVTSRCSYEMVHKAAALGAAAIAAVSAPTSLAIETAEQAGIALAAFVREGRLTVYANADRISP